MEKRAGEELPLKEPAVKETEPLVDAQLARRWVQADEPDQVGAEALAQRHFQAGVPAC